MAMVSRIGVRLFPIFPVNRIMATIQWSFPAAPGVAGTFSADRNGTYRLSGWRAMHGHWRLIRWPDRTELALLISILGFFFILHQSGPVLRLLDPVAATVDLGVLSFPLLAVWSLLLFLAVSRWLLGLLWPVFRDFRRYHFEPIFKSLLPWQKILFYLACYFLLLYAFVLCLAAVC